MSYSAYVICSCYKDGLTVDPPHKEYLVFDDVLMLEDEQTEYAYIIEPLKRLAKASIISGNPIHWC
jgi:hypothetical protein